MHFLAETSRTVLTPFPPSFSNEMKEKLTLRVRQEKCVSALYGLTFFLTTFVNRGKWKKRRGTVEIVREMEKTEDKVGKEKEKKEGKGWENTDNSGEKKGAEERNY